MVHIEKVVKALNSETRRKILKILAEEPKTVKEVVEALRKSYSINLKYRESVFKALERLVEADLVEKHYGKERRVVYKLKKKEITLDLTEEVAR
ncbi:MAG: ArsR/SmtB family transcription factor [Candidatus Methanospirareceae archaeon]